ncbi:MAG: hypothetical protein ACLQBK_16470 [Candidatus Sulfotelmatobacter sp.]
MAPTSLLAAVVLLMASQQIKAISGSIPRGEVHYHLGEIAIMGLLRFGSFFLSWLLGCFALAAIATVTYGLDGGDDGAGWRHDSYTRAREHFGSILLFATISFCAYGVGGAGVLAIEGAVTRVVGWARFSRYNYPFVVIGLIAVGSIVSWIGTAIPLVIRNSTKLRAALKRSVEVSNGYEGALFLLVVESLAGSSLVWYVTLHGIGFLVPDPLRYSVWYGWLANLVGVLAAAAVEPPLFIGLSLLADSELFKPSSLPGS